MITVSEFLSKFVRAWYKPIRKQVFNNTRLLGAAAFKFTMLKDYFAGSKTQKEEKCTCWEQL